MVETAQHIYSMVSKPYVLLALSSALDSFIGDPKWLPHPVRVMGVASAKMEYTLRRLIKSEKIAGASLVIIMVGLTFGLSHVANFMLLNSHYPVPISYLSLLLMVFLISTTLATRGLIDSARLIIEDLKAGDIDGARRNLGHIVGRDTDALDEKGIVRATIESLAENASDGIIAPLFYFVIGGLPLAMTYKAVNTLDSMIGYKNEKYKDFGWAAARLDDIANYIPARITGILIVIASAVFSFSTLTANRSLRTMFHDGGKHPSPNSGIPEAAMAGALGLRLGGPSSYGGKIAEKPYIGEDIQGTKNRYLESSKKAVTITMITSLLGFVIALAILCVRTQ